MRFLTNAKAYLINYVVTCASEPYTMQCTFYGKSVGDAKAQFRLSKGGLFKIVSIVEI